MTGEVPAWKQAILRAREEKARQEAESNSEEDLNKKFAHLPAWKRDHAIKKAKATLEKEHAEQARKDELEKTKGQNYKHATALALETAAKFENDEPLSRRASFARASSVDPGESIGARLERLSARTSVSEPSSPVTRRRRSSSAEVRGFTLIDAVPVKDSAPKTPQFSSNLVPSRQESVIAEEEEQDSEKEKAAKAEAAAAKREATKIDAAAKEAADRKAAENENRENEKRDRDAKDAQAAREEVDKAAKSKARKEKELAEKAAQVQKEAAEKAAREEEAAAKVEQEEKERKAKEQALQAEKDVEKARMEQQAKQAAEARRAKKEAEEAEEKKRKEREEQEAQAIKDRAKSRQAHPDLVQTHDDGSNSTGTDKPKTGIEAGVYTPEPVPDNETPAQTKARKMRDRVNRQKAMVIRRQLATKANAAKLAAEESEQEKIRTAEENAKAEKERIRKEKEAARLREIEEDERRERERIEANKKAWEAQKEERDRRENASAEQKAAAEAKEKARRESVLNSGPTPTMSWPKGCLPDPKKLKLKRSISWVDAGGDPLAEFAPVAFYDDEEPEDVQTNQIKGGAGADDDDDEDDGLSTPVHTQVKKRASPKKSSAPSMTIPDAAKNVSITARENDALPNDNDAATFSSADAPSLANMLW